MNTALGTLSKEHKKPSLWEKRTARNKFKLKPTGTLLAKVKELQNQDNETSVK